MSRPATQSTSFDPIQDLLVEARRVAGACALTATDLRDAEVRGEYVKVAELLALTMRNVEAFPSRKNQDLLRSATGHFEATCRTLREMIVKRAFEVGEKKGKRSRKI